jgi:hypothetical protein
VLVVEVDVVDAQPPQRALAGLAQVLGLAADAALGGIVGIAHDGELRGQEDRLAAAGDGAPDQLLVLAEAVHVGRVEERDAQLQRAVDGTDGFGVVGGAVELGHAHAAEPHFAHQRTVATKSALLHRPSDSQRRVSVSRPAPACRTGR